MRYRAPVWMVAALGIAALAGCGSGTHVGVSSGLEGSYTGTYLMVELADSQTGDVELSISYDGRIAGTFVDSATSAQGTFFGTVNTMRRCRLLIVYPTRTVSGEGDLALSDTQRLVGVLAQKTEHGTPAGSFNLDCALH